MAFHFSRKCPSAAANLPKVNTFARPQNQPIQPDFVSPQKLMGCSPTEGGGSSERGVFFFIFLQKIKKTHLSPMDFLNGHLIFSKQQNMKNLFLRIATLLFLATAFSCQKDSDPSTPIKTLRLEPAKAAEIANKIRQSSPAKVADGLELSLWASDSLLADPIAISVDPQGRIFYTSATRQANSEFDIRGHRNWMTASISFQTVEDRRKFLRETFTADSDESKKFLKDLNKDGKLDWHDLTVEKEQVWFLSDPSGDGVADEAQLYYEGFNEEITDVANGVKYANGEVYITVGPDLWRTGDKDGNGVADQVESISHGFAVHIGFSGHGMSGVTLGPDGRIWWQIGDIGMNVTDKEGKNWKYPNQGVIARCEPDGSGFEVYSAGQRNTHVFVFDEYGNLITEDNDGDHPDERERLVYLINGSDCGWRTNWQFGKYTDPDNNEYKVWMDEKLGVPRWDGQAAYILPPIVNYVNGPTGMVYNPGTALGERWYKHFFIAEFRGSPTNSPIHAFTLKPNGAGFQLDKTQEVVSGLLPTSLDWGPDGALYFADWIDGWGTKDAGRIWKLDEPGGAATAIRKETKALIEADFSGKKEAELAVLLAQQDMRVRVKAQHELAKRGAASLATFLAVAQNGQGATARVAPTLPRIHALWGIGQLARKDNALAKNFLPFLADSDPEIVAQAAKMIGDVRYKAGGDAILPLLKNASPRVQLFATEALGRLAHEPALQPIIEMVVKNDDRDNWLRHAAQIALSRIGKAAPLVALSSHPSKAARMTAVVALRRMSDPGIAIFLKDKEESVVTEAARGINDDYSIEAALPALASVLAETRFTNEPLIRRAINANLRVGKPENIDLLVKYAARSAAPAVLRAEAIAAFGTWAKPSVMDRVDGMYRGEIKRDAAPAKAAFLPAIKSLLTTKNEPVQVAAAHAAAKLGINEMAGDLFVLLKQNPSKAVRIAALKALGILHSDQLLPALETALADKEPEVRSVALEIIPGSGLPEEKAVSLFAKVLQTGTMEEQQAALTSLGGMKGASAVATLGISMEQLLGGKLAPGVQLDVVEAVEKQADPTLLKSLASYQSAKPADDPLSPFREALAGGNADKGRDIFFSHEAAQCVRCHTVYEWGGDAGPHLDGVGERLSAEQLLESLIVPSAAFALNYGMVALEMKGGEELAGIVESETETVLKLKIDKTETREVDKTQIAKRVNVPSAMTPVGKVLTKKEIRDLVAFLVGLKEEEE